MFAALQVVKPPAVEPVSVDLLRMHARIDQAGEDLLLAGYITAARTWIELYLSRVLITQQLQWVIAHETPRNGYPFLSLPLTLLVLPLWYQWPFSRNQGGIELPRLPVQSVDAVTYGQWGLAEDALAAGVDYDVDILTGRFRVHPGAEVIPNDHMAVLFTAGYGDDPEDVPQTVRLAIQMLATFLYEHRGDAGGEMPAAVQMLLSPHRLFHFG